MSDPWIVKDGEWWNQPRTWRHVIRCLRGRHKVAFMALLDAALVSRCSCGGIRRGYGPWFDAKPMTRRKGNR